MKYINVAVFANIDNILTYKVPEGMLVKKGSRVVVPLGKKTAVGVMTEAVNNTGGIHASRMKSVQEVMDEEPVLSKEMLDLGKWISEYYLSAPGLVYSSMLSALFKVKTKKTVILQQVNDTSGYDKKELDVIAYLEKRRGKKSNIMDIKKNTGINNISGVIDSLEEKGIIVLEDIAKIKTSRKEIIAPKRGGSDTKEITLNDWQKNAVKKVIDSFGNYKAFLLFGQTGSGKTEVYIKCAEHCVKTGKQAIILVPEIFLTPQIMNRFKGVFGERAAVFHSGLSESERYHEWMKMKSGNADVVIGTRSAVFVPFDNVGLIVVDEEFDSSYKQDNDPRYNARDVALYRGRMNNGAVVLGSATPAVETYYNAMREKYEMLRLPERVEKRPMPEIHVVDMTRDWQNSSNLFLSGSLIDDMRDSMENDEQAILFINRRGFANYVLCKKCGHVEKCEDCDIPLVYHKTKELLMCHYCDAEKKPPVNCPKCKTKLSYRGVGTQKIEDVIKKIFPGKRVLRVDLDSMKKKDDYFTVYDSIKNREIDILIGTQMIAKGFDFPEVTFVGVVGIDSVLNLPDFRAEERGFQLLMQVAGRTGRGKKKGKVVLQTYAPDSEGVRYVKGYDIENFYKEQLELRKALNYPPFSYMVQIIVQNEDFTKGEKESEKVGVEIHKCIKDNNIKTIDVLGPVEAPISRIRNRYRFTIIMKGKTRKDLKIVAKKVKSMSRGREIAVVVDPASTL